MPPACRVATSRSPDCWSRVRNRAQPAHRMQPETGNAVADHKTQRISLYSHICPQPTEVTTEEVKLSYGDRFPAAPG